MKERAIPVSGAAHSLLKNLAEREGVPAGTVLERALEAYRRYRLLQDADEAYAALPKSSSERESPVQRLVAYAWTEDDAAFITRRPRRWGSRLG